MQTNHHNSSFQKHNFPIVLVCDNITKAPNIGSLFRTAEAFGVEKLIFCGENVPLGRRMTKTSRATEKSVVHEVHKTILDVVTELKKQGYLIVSLEITSGSLPIHKYRFPSQPLALILGDENHGISEPVLKQSDVSLHIDMFGHNSSMNVVQAASIALYEITKQIRYE
jgi:tRNA G18 (ribose-2'-O)-methylase SpoU